MPNLLSTVFALVLGIWIIVSSISMIKIALAIRKEESSWGILFALGAINLIAGIFMLFNPFETALSIVTFSGIILMVHATISIIDMIIVRNKVKSISKAFEKVIK